MKPLICFDLDNTLVESNKVHITSFNKAFRKFRLKQISAKRLVKELTGQRSEDVLRKLYPRLSKNIAKKLLKYRIDVVSKETYKYAKQIDRSASILKELKRDYKIVLISNCRHREINAILKGAKIDKNLFDIRIGKDEVNHPKPSPDEIFKAQHLAKRKASYMVGDSIYDIRAGKKAKVKTIAVLTGNNTFKQIKKEKPYKIIKSIKELPNAIN